MVLDGKLKRTALLVAVDFCLRKMNHSPKRCARNLLELGSLSYPGKLSKEEEGELYLRLLVCFEDGDPSAARALILSAYH